MRTFSVKAITASLIGLSPVLIEHRVNSVYPRDLSTLALARNVIAMHEQMVYNSQEDLIQMGHKTAERGQFTWRASG